MEGDIGAKRKGIGWVWQGIEEVQEDAAYSMGVVRDNMDDYSNNETYGGY